MARPIKHDGGLFKRAGSKVWWMQYRDKAGQRQRESTGTEDWNEGQRILRERLQARDNNIPPSMRRGQEMTFGEWADSYLKNFSQPPFRAQKTHEMNQRAMTHLRDLFEKTRLARVLRRMLNVAVRKKLLAANPCSGVEFPARVDGLFRPHYMGWSEQQGIEFHAPEYLKNVIQIVTETGLRIYKELAPLRKEHLDLTNRTVWIPDSRTVNGVAEVPLTDIAIEAFRRQFGISGPGPFLFPSDEDPNAHQKSFKTAWRATLRRARVPYFRIYDLRSTYATRLSAGGVADEFVTQLLRQGDAKVFKKYSQMKLQMKREALGKLNRNANEGGKGSDTGLPN